MMLESYAYNSEWGGGDWQVCPGTGGAHNFVNGVCSACNMLLPTDVYPDYCGRCGRLKLQCVCCPVCHNFPCSCSHGEGGDQGEIITCTKPGCPDPYHCNGTCGGGSGGGTAGVGTMQIVAQDITTAAGLAVELSPDVTSVSTWFSKCCRATLSIWTVCGPTIWSSIGAPIRTNGCGWNRAKKLSAWRTTDGSSWQVGLILYRTVLDMSLSLFREKWCPVEVERCLYVWILVTICDQKSKV